MKKKYIIIIITVVLVSIYLGYKIFLLNYYNIKNNFTEIEEVNKILEGINIKDEITIKTKKIDNDYLELNEFKIKNDFKDFVYNEELSDDESKKYILYGDDEKVLASFWIGVTYPYTELLNNDITMYVETVNNIKNYNIKEILEDNNITNDIELIKYVSNYNFNDNNIFTNSKKIKNDYLLESTILIAFPNIEYITEIKGDYIGYILNINNVKEVSILKNNKRYILTFISNEYFNDEYIYDLLNTIVIE